MADYVLEPVSSSNRAWDAQSLEDCLWKEQEAFELLQKELSPKHDDRIPLPVCSLGGELPSAEELEAAYKQVLAADVGDMPATEFALRQSKRRLLALRKCLATIAAKVKEKKRPPLGRDKEAANSPLLAMGVRAAMSLFFSVIRNAARDLGQADVCVELLADIHEMLGGLEPLTLYHHADAKSKLGRKSLLQISKFLHDNSRSLASVDQEGHAHAIRIELMLQEGSASSLIATAQYFLAVASNEEELMLPFGVYGRSIVTLKKLFDKRDAAIVRTEEQPVPHYKMGADDSRVASLLAKAANSEPVSAVDYALGLLGCSSDLAQFFLPGRVGGAGSLEQSGVAMVMITGKDDCGQRGGSGSVPTSKPTYVDRSPKDLRTGNSCCFLLDNEGTLFAVGKGDYCRLGTGSSSNTSSLTQLTIPKPILTFEVGLGYGHGLAIDEDGGLWVWGDADYGKLGTGGTHLPTPAVVPFMAGKVVMSVSAGAQHSAAIADDVVYTWGLVDNNRLGYDQSNGLPTPVPLPDNIGTPDFVVCGQDHTMVVMESGAVVCMGQNIAGPTVIESLAGIQIVDVKCGEAHGILLSATGLAYSYGSSAFSGHGRDIPLGSPEPLESLAGVVSIECSQKGSFAITERGDIYFWGENECSIAPSASSTVIEPVLLPELSGCGIKQVNAGTNNAIFSSLQPERGVASNALGVQPVARAPFSVQLNEDCFTTLRYAIAPLREACYDGEKNHFGLAGASLEYYVSQLLQLTRVNVFHHVLNGHEDSEIDPKGTDVLAFLRGFLVKHLDTSVPPLLRRAAQTTFAESWSALLPHEADQRLSLLSSLLQSAENDLKTGAIAESVIFLTKVLQEASCNDPKLMTTLGVPVTTACDAVDPLLLQISNRLLKVNTGLLRFHANSFVSGVEVDQPHCYLQILLYFQERLIAQIASDKSRKVSESAVMSVAVDFGRMILEAGSADINAVSSESDLDSSAVSSLLENSVLRLLVPHFMYFLKQVDLYEPALSLLVDLDRLLRNFSGVQEIEKGSLSFKAPASLGESCHWLFEVELTIASAIGRATRHSLLSTSLSDTEAKFQNWMPKEIFASGMKESDVAFSGKHDLILTDLLAEEVSKPGSRSLVEKMLDYAQKEWLLTPMVDEEHDCIDQLMRTSLACQLHHHGLVSLAAMYSEKGGPAPPALTSLFEVVVSIRNKVYSQLSAEYPNLAAEFSDPQECRKEEAKLLSELSRPVLTRLRFLTHKVRAAIPVEETFANTQDALTQGPSSGAYFDLRSSAPVVKVRSSQTFDRQTLLGSLKAQDDASLRAKNALLSANVEKAMVKPMAVVLGTLRKYQPADTLDMKEARETLRQQVFEFAFDIDIDAADVEEAFKKQQQRADERLVALNRALALLDKLEDYLPSASWQLAYQLLRGNDATTFVVSKDVYAASRDTKELLAAANSEFLLKLIVLIESRDQSLNDLLSSKSELLALDMRLSLLFVFAITQQFTAADVNGLVGAGVLPCVVAPLLYSCIQDRRTKFVSLSFDAGERLLRSLMSSLGLFATAIDIDVAEELQAFIFDLVAALSEKNCDEAGRLLDYLRRILISGDICCYFATESWINLLLKLANSSSLLRDRLVALRVLLVLLDSLDDDTVIGLSRRDLLNELTALFVTQLATSHECVDVTVPGIGSNIAFSEEVGRLRKVKIEGVNQDIAVQTEPARVKKCGFAFCNVGMSSGKHRFSVEVLSDKANDESLLIGVANKKAVPGPDKSFKFEDKKHSWLYRAFNGHLENKRAVQPEVPYPRFTMGDVVTVTVDMSDPEDGSMWFSINGKPVNDSPIFTGIVGPVYPIVVFYNADSNHTVSAKVFDYVSEAEADTKLNVKYAAPSTTLCQELVELLRFLQAKPAWKEDLQSLVRESLESLPSMKSHLSECSSQAAKAFLAELDAGRVFFALQYVSDCFQGARMGARVETQMQGAGTVLGFNGLANNALVLFDDAAAVKTISLDNISPIQRKLCDLQFVSIGEGTLRSLASLVTPLSDKQTAELHFLQVAALKTIWRLSEADSYLSSLLHEPSQPIIRQLIDVASQPLPVKSILGIRELEGLVLLIRELVYREEAEPGTLSSVDETDIGDGKEHSLKEKDGKRRQREAGDKLDLPEELEEKQSSILAEDESAEALADSAKDPGSDTQSPSTAVKKKKKKRGILSRMFGLLSGGDSDETDEEGKATFTKRRKREKNVSRMSSQVTVIPDQELLETFFSFDQNLDSSDSTKVVKLEAALKKKKFTPIRFRGSEVDIDDADDFLQPPTGDSEELSALVSFLKENAHQGRRVLCLVLSGLQILYAREALVEILAKSPMRDEEPMVDMSLLGTDEVRKLVQIIRLVVCGRSSSTAQEGVSSMTQYLLEHCKLFRDDVLQYSVKSLFALGSADTLPDSFSSDAEALSSARFAIIKEVLSRLDPSSRFYYEELLDGLCVATLADSATPQQRAWSAAQVATIVHSGLTSTDSKVSGKVIGDKSAVFRQFIVLLPGMVRDQMAIEKSRAATDRNSTFLQSLVALSYMLKSELPSSLDSYVDLIDASKALVERDRSFSTSFVSNTRFPVPIERLPHSDVKLAADNCNWTLSMDRMLLDWKQSNPNEWSNPTDVLLSGDASLGQLADLDFSPPTPIVSEAFGSLSPHQIAGGESCTFVLTTEGTVFATGKGDYGRLGIGHSNNVRRLTELNFGGKEVLAIDSSNGGYGHGLALDSQGKLWSWGDGDYGKLGHGNTDMLTSPKLIPTLATSNVTAFSAGHKHSAAVTADGNLFVWGSYEEGRLGLNTNQSHVTSPTLVTVLEGLIDDVACGDALTIAITKTGEVWTWGMVSSEVIPDQGPESYLTPTLLGSEVGEVIQAAAGFKFGMVLNKRGEVWIWGGNENGLNGEEAILFNTPTVVDGLENVHIIEIAAGPNHLLALSDEGFVYAWGSNASGQCGVGDQCVMVPTKIESVLPRRMAHVSAGHAHSIMWTSENCLEKLVPENVPVEYSKLETVRGAALLIRLKFLARFSELVFRNLSMYSYAGKRWFGFNELRFLLTAKTKKMLLDSGLQPSMSTSDHGPSITLNRFLASRPSHSVFAQTARKLMLSPDSALRCATRAFRVELTGEGSYDAGGPYNDVISCIGDELMEGKTSVLESSPNHKAKEGTCQDCVIPSVCITKRGHKMYRFLGQYLGIAIRTKSPVSLQLPPMFWKLMAGEDLSVDDLLAVDKTFVDSHRLLLDLEKNGIDEEAFQCLPLEMFPPLSMGLGSSLSLSFSNRSRYVHTAVQQRLTAWSREISLIKEGMYSIVPSFLLALFSWEELETLICGSPTFDWEKLKLVASYQQYTSTSDPIVWLWEVLNSLSNKDASRFLRFVWGKSRLPSSVSTPFVIEMLAGGDTTLPRSATCFFKLSLPSYSSKQILQQRLLTAITFCSAIDTDNDAGMQGFDDAVEDQAQDIN